VKDSGPHAGADSWFRVIMEKPFGFDLDTSEELAQSLGKLLAEEHIYRIDHYLGKELVQNLLILRFANSIMGAWWSRHYISNVQITFKEDFGTLGRGGYFDQYGIIRDVIQNHLMQVLALLTMEAPVSMHPDDVRDEKVKVIRCMTPIQPEDCILGQYVAGNGQTGYLEDPTVPKDSRQATYAATKLYIRNERWEGVPFMIKAGKALNERLAVVRVQLKTPPLSIFGDLSNMRNELVIKMQPGEAIYVKMVVKKPGLEIDKEMSELDLTYPERYKDIVIPDAYERLILDCIRGDQQHFVRRDELRAAWAVCTPLLHAIDKGQVPLELYEYGSRGPASVDNWSSDSGYIKTDYVWQANQSQDDLIDKGRAGIN
jgi:glucose-6-phosphate 1-dehydrogenase